MLGRESVTMTNLAEGDSINRVILIATFLALTSMGFLSCGVSISAQEIVEESCSRMDAVNDFDVTTQVSSYEPGDPPVLLKGVINAEVSGDDFRAVMTLSSEGTVLGTIEVRRVNDNSYYRENDGPWRTDIPATGSDFPYSRDSLCPDLGEVAQVGEETIDGVPVNRYFFSVDQDLGPVGNVDDSGSPDNTVGTDENWDVWVDDTGVLVQTKQSILIHADGGGLEGSSEFVSKVSGIDEPNVITAPDIP